jgi:hypothetical protein
MMYRVFYHGEDASLRYDIDVRSKTSAEFELSTEFYEAINSLCSGSVDGMFKNEPFHTSQSKSEVWCFANFLPDNLPMMREGWSVWVPVPKQGCSVFCSEIPHNLYLGIRNILCLNQSIIRAPNPF